MARAPDGTEQEIWNDVTGISSGSCNKIASGLGEQCQLNVCIVTPATRALFFIFSCAIYGHGKINSLYAWKCSRDGAARN
jgi:hypothetical protein